MDVLLVINKELEYWEQQRQDAATRYNQATVAIETLWQLTERMKEAAHESDYKFSREEKEAASGD
jgi:hypothetical protein